jgi:hypothetical protein
MFTFRNSYDNRNSNGILRLRSDSQNLGLATGPPCGPRRREKS